MSETTNTEIMAMQPEETAKPYELRRLESSDVFSMFRIISKIGIKEFKACFEDERVGVVIEKLFNKTEGESNGALYSVAGVVLAPAIDIILSNIPKAEEEIYSLLARLSGMKADKIKKLDAVVFVEMIVDVIQKPEFPDFFKVVSKLFK